MSMLLGFVEFLKTNWVWLVISLVIVVCIIILLLTDSKGEKKLEELEENVAEGKTDEAVEEVLEEAAREAKASEEADMDEIVSSEKAQPEATADGAEGEAELESLSAEAEQTRTLPILEEKDDEESEKNGLAENDGETPAEIAPPSEQDRANGSEPEPVREPGSLDGREAPAEVYEDTSLPEEEPAEETAALREKFKADREQSVDEEDHTDVVVRHPDAKKETAQYRVVYDRETFTWVVKKDSNTRVTRRVKTKKEALEIARELSRKQDVNVTIHKKDGKFQKK